MVLVLLPSLQLPPLVRAIHVFIQAVVYAPLTLLDS